MKVNVAHDLSRTFGLYLSLMPVALLRIYISLDDTRDAEAIREHCNRLKDGGEGQSNPVIINVYRGHPVVDVIEGDPDGQIQDFGRLHADSAWGEDLIEAAVQCQITHLATFCDIMGELEDIDDRRADLVPLPCQIPLRVNRCKPSEVGFDCLAMMTKEEAMHLKGIRLMNQVT